MHTKLFPFKFLTYSHQQIAIFERLVSGICILFSDIVYPKSIACICKTFRCSEYIQPPEKDSQIKIWW